MQSRDWILMLVPIVFSGVLIFIMQMYFKNLIDRNNKSQE